MHEAIRGGTYRDVTDGTLVRVYETSTDRETNTVIISFRPQTQNENEPLIQLSEAEFLQRYSFVV